MVERVVEREPLKGQTTEVTDPSISGRQSVAFAPVADGVEVELTLSYRLRRRSPVTPLSTCCSSAGRWPPRWRPRSADSHTTAGQPAASTAWRLLDSPRMSVTESATRLAELVRAADSVVALTGAGISVPSGIPDFRSPRTGLWENVDPMEVAHIDVFRADPQRFWHFYGQRFQTLEDKRPNRAHEVLAELERAGLLDAVITQNIDRLHAEAGSRELIEVHGTIAHASCPRCSTRYPLVEVRARQAADTDAVPRCDCGAPLKPDVVLFGECCRSPRSSGPEPGEQAPT